MQSILAGKPLESACCGKGISEEIGVNNDSPEDKERAAIQGNLSILK